MLRSHTVYSYNFNHFYLFFLFLSFFLDKSKTKASLVNAEQEIIGMKLKTLWEGACHGFLR